MDGLLEANAQMHMTDEEQKMHVHYVHGQNHGMHLYTKSRNCLTDVFCQVKEETISKEIGDFPRFFPRSHEDAVMLRHTNGVKHSGEDLTVDGSANAKQAVGDTENFLKENVECSSSIGIGVSDGDDTCKTNKHPVPNQLQRASSADSQLTSSDGDSIAVSDHPPGGFVIDCNVIPESNLEEQVQIL